ncbi:hypothetical protein [uncultured Draconibacterium sp.]|uniref:hypothetical protein n=1 Tax=uncultured Draconibacterium sp. TaxID=1573823 RepID=UPI0029C92A4D|nr:hypothetical protein [uncultured Draconibacterium sp.]
MKATIDLFNDDTKMMIKYYILSKYGDLIRNEEGTITDTCIRKWLEVNQRDYSLNKFNNPKGNRFRDVVEFLKEDDYLGLRSDSLLDLIKAFNVPIKLSNRKVNLKSNYLGFFPKSWHNKKKEHDNNTETLLMEVDFGNKLVNVSYREDDKGLSKGITYKGEIDILGETSSINLVRTNNTNRHSIMLMPKLSIADDNESFFFAVWSRRFRDKSLSSTLIFFVKIDEIDNWKDTSFLQKKGTEYLSALNVINDQRISVNTVKVNSDLQDLELIYPFDGLISKFEENDTLSGAYYYYYIIHNEEGQYIRRTPFIIQKNHFFIIKHYNKHSKGIKGKIKFLNDDFIRLDFTEEQTKVHGNNFSTLYLKYSEEKMEGIITGITSDKKPWSSPVIVLKEDIDNNKRTHNYIEVSELCEEHVPIKNELKTFFSRKNKSFPNYLNIIRTTNNHLN